MRAKHHPPLATLRHILVIRLSSLGDILLTTPVLRLLRTAYPAARIDVLVKAMYADLLSMHPGVDRLMLFDPRQSLWTTWQTLRHTRYDLVLDLHRTLRSRLLTRGLSATHRLTYNKHRLRRTLFVYGGWRTLQAMPPVPERYAAPLRRLGLHTPLSGLEMHLEPATHRAMQHYLAQTFPESRQRPLLAIAPGARWPTKRWPAERFAIVADTLARQHRAAVVILGDAADVPLTSQLCRRLTVPVLNTTGQLSLMQTAAVLHHCRLLLCNDSGLMHMATALQVPVVAIFGPTVREFGFYPFRAQGEVISLSLPCRPCSTQGSMHCPLGHHHCMQHLTSAQVLAAAQRVWEGKGTL